MLDIAVLCLVVAAFCVLFGITRWLLVAALLLLFLYPFACLALLAVVEGAFCLLCNR